MSSGAMVLVTPQCKLFTEKWIFNEALAIIYQRSKPLVKTARSFGAARPKSSRLSCITRPHPQTESPRGHLQPSRRHYIKILFIIWNSTNSTMRLNVDKNIKIKMRDGIDHLEERR